MRREKQKRQEEAKRTKKCFCSFLFFLSFLLPLLVFSVADAQQSATKQARQPSLREINKVAQPASDKPIAIIGVTLIDGRGGAPIEDAVVVVRGERIMTAGKRASVGLPNDAEVIDAHGQTLLPGFIDSHFHIDGDNTLPALFL